MKNRIVRGTLLAWMLIEAASASALAWDPARPEAIDRGKSVLEPASEEGGKEEGNPEKNGTKHHDSGQAAETAPPKQRSNYGYAGLAIAVQDGRLDRWLPALSFTFDRKLNATGSPRFLQELKADAALMTAPGPRRDGPESLRLSAKAEIEASFYALAYNDDPEKSLFAGVEGRFRGGERDFELENLPWDAGVGPSAGLIVGDGSGDLLVKVGRLFKVSGEHEDFIEGSLRIYPFGRQNAFGRIRGRGHAAIFDGEPGPRQWILGVDLVLPEVALGIEAREFVREVAGTEERSALGRISVGVPIRR